MNDSLRDVRNEERNTICRVAGRVMTHMGSCMAVLKRRARSVVCRLGVTVRLLLAEPEKGAVTAEYAVVLVAATGFAALLVALMESDAVKALLMNIVKKALNV